jgi:hypothetical protein
MEGHISLDIKGLDKIIDFNPETGVLIAQAGVLTTDVISLTMPFGWYLCGLSGSLHNTLAGDISNNVNGKDSWKYGNFGLNVISMKIFLSDGSLQEVNALLNPDLFNAIIGGIGLLGIITEVVLQLKKIPSFMLEKRTEKFANIQTLLSKMEQLDELNDDFFYTWIDPFARGEGLGRGFSDTAKFIKNNDAVSTDVFRNGLLEEKRIGIFTPKTFWNIIKAFESQSTIRVANFLKYHLPFSDQKKTNALTFPEYQYPMAKDFPKFNLKFGPKGFHEFQLLFHYDNFEEVFRELLQLCRTYKNMPQLCSIKKHKSDPFHLSFSGEGYSFTINYPLSVFPMSTLRKFNDEIINAVLKHKGKINLGKYPYVTYEDCRSMYPLFDQFVKVKNKYNPDSLFSSDAAKQIFL